jgi:hypothetical protein
MMRNFLSKTEQSTSQDGVLAVSLNKHCIFSLIEQIQSSNGTAVVFMGRGIMDYNKYFTVLEATLSRELSKPFSLSTLDQTGILTMVPKFH